MTCPKCDSKFIMVISKTKIRKRSFFGLCKEGHIMMKKENNYTLYGIYLSSHFYYGNMIWMNR